MKTRQQIFSIVMCFVVTIQVLGAGVLWTEDFEGYTTGATYNDGAGPWNGDSDGDYTVQVDGSNLFGAGASNQVMRVFCADGAQSYKSWVDVVSAATGPTIATWSLDMYQLGGGAIYMTTGSGAPAGGTKFATSTWINGSLNTSTSYNMDTLLRVDLVCNTTALVATYPDGTNTIAANTMDIWINNSKVRSLPRESTASVITGLKINAREEDTAYTYIDNVTLREGIYVTGGISQPYVSNQIPTNGQVHVNPTALFSWQGNDATSPTFDMNIGTDSNCNDIIAGQSTGGSASYTPAAGVLSYATQYYWRVDLTDGGTEYPGNVLTLTTGGKATDPVPDDGSIADRSLGQLSWQGDDFVSSYDVYFGFPGNLIFVDNVTVTSVTYGQLAAALSQTVLDGGDYQWKVNTKRSGGALMVEGDLWSVTITDPEPVVIEDFYGYADTAALLQVWSDGSTNGTGSTVTCENLVGIARFDYDNTSSPFKSEMTYSYQTPQSWLANAAESFEFSFRGVETNSTESLFVSITDGSNTGIVECILPDPTTNSWWRQCRIRLSDISAQGVDLTNITAFTIRAGDGTAGGTGQLYIDDVILGLSDCFDEYRPQADFNGDCKVGADDLRLLAEVWLLSDFTVSSVAPASGPVAHYSFEETSGLTASDSSGNGHHAAVTTASSIWQSGGYAGRCIEIDGTTEIALPASVFSSVTDELTLCLWLKGDPAEYSDSVDHVEFMAGDSTAHMTTWDLLRWDMTASADYGPDWVHYAVVKDATAQTVQLFRNGILVGEIANAVKTISGTSADITTLTTLADSFNDLPVRLDELTVYDSALTQQEIVHVAYGPSSQILQPIEPVYTDRDLSDDGTVNLAECGTLASEWLEE